MKEKICKNKGITLIALVITIVVLLILAGVTINIVINKGIIDKTQKTVDEYKISDYKERIELIKTGEQFKKLNNESEDSLKNLVVEKLRERENENWVKEVETSEDDEALEENQIKVITQDKYIIIAEIEENGKITYIIEKDNGEPRPDIDVEQLALEGIENEKIKIKVEAKVEGTKKTKKIEKIELIKDGITLETKTYTDNKLTREEIFEVEENGEYKIKATTDQEKSAIKRIKIDIEDVKNKITITSKPTTSRNTESTGIQNGIEKGTIIVTINYGETELQKQYKVGTEEWQVTNETSIQIPVTENKLIAAKYYDGKNSYKVENYNIQNVDNVAPNEFNITTTNTTNSITVTAKTEDTASKGAGNGIAGILRYEYRINNGKWQTSKEFTNLTTGRYMIQAKAIDKAGNERISTNTETITLGTISTEDIEIKATPTTSRNTESAGTQNGVETGPITVTITYGKNNYTKQYKVGSENWQTVSGTSTNVSITTNTIIAARYYDGTNGFETSSYNIQNVDNVAPTFTSYDATLSGTTITVSATVTDTASVGAAKGIEGIESIKYSIDGTNYKISNTFTISAGGNYTIYIKAIDKAGNETIVTKIVTVNQYTINFDANGGDVSTTSKTVIPNTEYGELPIPSRTGYKFVGWYTSSTDGTEITSNTIANITTNQTLYAHWIEIDTKMFSKEYGVIDIVWLNTDNTVRETPISPKDYLGELEAIKYDDTNTESDTNLDWILADTSNINNNWYNYVAQTGNNDGKTSNWANARTSDKNAYFVWIPRYAYKITYFKTEAQAKNYNENGSTDGIIGYSNINGFVKLDGDVKKLVSDSEPSNVTGTVKTKEYSDYIPHPAFDFDGAKPGIWVGKYISSGTADELTIKPNTKILKDVSVGQIISTSKNIKTKYSLTNINDTHMMKNTEWGAVVYLTESKYGRNRTEVKYNNSSSDVSGNNYKSNILQSSTGNIYGVYDLNSYSCERVAGVLNDKISDGSNYDFGTDTKYYDAYPSDYEDSKKIKGDAIYETSKSSSAYLGSWHNDSAFYVNSSYPIFSRGRLLL